MKRQLLALVALSTVQAAVLLFLAAPGAHADEPLQQGWWTAASIGAPAQPPSDVPSDGLLVQGGVNNPSAFAAVVYDVAAGATVGQLTLTVARPSATTPGAKLEACPLTVSSITPEQGGAMSDAPHYNCAHKATGAPSKDGNTYAFSVSNLVTSGALAVAILPTTSSDRVVFSKPGTSSLPVTQSVAGGTPPPFDSAPAPANNPAPLAPAGGASLAAAPPGQSGPSLPGPATTPPQPQVAPSPAPTTTPLPNGFTAASTGPGPGKSSPAAVGLTLGGVAVAAALWAYAGRNKEQAAPEEV
jgi:hypothetical protein